jgi:hypothetical protein
MPQRKRLHKRHVLALAASVCLLASCGSPTEPQNTAPGTPSAVIGGTTVTLDAFAYRNMQPSVPPPDTSLAVVARLQTATAPFPSNISVRSMVVTYTATGQRWSPASVDARPQLAGAPFRDFAGGGGPQWPVGSMVDIRVTVVDGGGNTFILERQGVPIAAPI